MITMQPRDSPLSVLKTALTGVGCLHMFFSIPARPNIMNYELKRFLINESSDGFKVLVIVQNKLDSVAISSFGHNTQKQLNF